MRPAPAWALSGQGQAAALPPPSPALPPPALPRPALPGPARPHPARPVALPPPFLPPQALLLQALLLRALLLRALLPLAMPCLALLVRLARRHRLVCGHRLVQARAAGRPGAAWCRVVLRMLVIRVILVGSMTWVWLETGFQRECWRDGWLSGWRRARIWLGGCRWSRRANWGMRIWPQPRELGGGWRHGRRPGNWPRSHRSRPGPPPAIQTSAPKPMAARSGCRPRRRRRWHWSCPCHGTARPDGPIWRWIWAGGWPRLARRWSPGTSTCTGR